MFLHLQLMHQSQKLFVCKWCIWLWQKLSKVSSLCFFFFFFFLPLSFFFLFLSYFSEMEVFLNVLILSISPYPKCIENFGLYTLVYILPFKLRIEAKSRVLHIEACIIMRSVASLQILAVISMNTHTRNTIWIK